MRFNSKRWRRAKRRQRLKLKQEFLECFTTKPPDPAYLVFQDWLADYFARICTANRI